MPYKPPVTLTEEQRRQLPILGQWLTVSQLADLYGMAPKTLRLIFEREPDLHALYKSGATKAVLKSAQTLTQKAWGFEERNEDGEVVKRHMPDTVCLLFHLKTQGRWRETDRLEVTGKDGGAIKHEHESVTIDPSKLSDAALEELRAAMAAQGDVESEGDGESHPVH